MTTKTMVTTDFRLNITDAMDAARDGDIIIVKHFGIESLVLMSIEEYQRLVDGREKE